MPAAAALPAREEFTRHRWCAPALAPELSAYGCEQHLRTCQRCGLIMITMIPLAGTLPWHEYRHPSGAWQRALKQRPPCPGKMDEAAA